MSPTDDPTAEPSLEALDANYLSFNDALMGSSAQGESAERSGVVLVSCGAPLARFNIAHVRRPFGDPAAPIEAAARFFDERALPFSFEFRAGADRRDGRDEAQKRLENALDSAGYHCVEPAIPGLALAPIPAIPPPPPELVIQRVETDCDRAAFVRTAAVGFGFPAEGGAAIFSPAFLARPEMEALLGRVDGEPVATSMLFRSGPIAGIYWVSTLPGGRRRGYGEALTWAAVAAGARAGCTVASLQASTMGRPVYDRMGFTHVIDYVRYQRVEVNEADEAGGTNAVRAVDRAS